MDADQIKAQKRQPAQVEGLACFASEELKRPLLRVRCSQEIEQGKRDRPRGVDELHRPAVDLSKRRPQDLMPADQIVDTLTQRVKIEGAPEAMRASDGKAGRRFCRW